MLMLILVGGGTGLIYMGAKDFLHTRKLAADGKPATATVVERKEWKVYKEQKTHHLVVAFQTESGERVTNDIMVTQDIYDSVMKGSSVNVIYFPKDPTICIVGKHAEVKYTRLVAGWAFLGAGILVFVLLRKNPNFGVIKVMTDNEMVEEARPIAVEGAQKAVQNLAPLVQTRHEFMKEHNRVNGDKATAVVR